MKAAADVEIVGLMVSLNREEVGRGGEICALDEVQKTYGFPTSAIVSMTDVVNHLESDLEKGKADGKAVLTPAILKAIKDYYERYGAK